MPTYVYHCRCCQKKMDVLKPVNWMEASEFCSHCARRMERIICFQGKMSPDTWQPEWNYGLGKVITFRNQIKEELKRIQGEEGREIVEVGNERVEVKKPDY